MKTLNDMFEEYMKVFPEGHLMHDDQRKQLRYSFYAGATQVCREHSNLYLVKGGRKRWAALVRGWMNELRETFDLRQEETAERNGGSDES